MDRPMMTHGMKTNRPRGGVQTTRSEKAFDVRGASAAGIPPANASGGQAQRRLL
jgi:hypothetical protein